MFGKKKNLTVVRETEITNRYGDRSTTKTETVRALELSDGTFEPLEGVNARPKDEWDWR